MSVRVLERPKISKFVSDGKNNRKFTWYIILSEAFVQLPLQRELLPKDVNIPTEVVRTGERKALTIHTNKIKTTNPRLDMFIIIVNNSV